MKISITLKPNARHEKVEKINNSEYHVAVNAPPLEGRANERLIEVLAKYFVVPKSSVRILSGLKSKKKLVEI